MEDQRIVVRELLTLLILPRKGNHLGELSLATFDYYDDEIHAEYLDLNLFSQTADSVQQTGGRQLLGTN